MDEQTGNNNLNSHKNDVKTMFAPERPIRVEVMLRCLGEQLSRSYKRSIIKGNGKRHMELDSYFEFD
ncbi:hypothetical protein PVK06_008999 [Gossypium arboreum]|uniref:Uncharacterized protein n=1 Tax=Gossypium arboreum TaxID=29729 RepID=A0ABR0QMF4_GOSAR|nr:hypothetical protein PVK06_008999 [Gossypium arboreum]